MLAENEKHPWTAIILTTVSGVAAVFGGLIVIMIGVPSNATLGHMLSFAAGVMLYISYGDLLPHAVIGIGFYWANVWMFAGMLFFAVVVMFIPEVELMEGEGTEPAAVHHGHAHGPVTSTPGATVSAKRLMTTGLIAAIGISLHNLPEGLVVYNATIGGICNESAINWAAPLADVVRQLLTNCLSRGVVVTWAIALHNIPEGMAVASPVYSSTRSKWKTMKYCIVSSLCEPIAAVVFGMFFNNYLTRYLMSALNAGVAGIMIMLSFVELIPAANQLVSPRKAVMSNLIGQAVMFFSVYAMYQAGAHTH